MHRPIRPDLLTACACALRAIVVAAPLCGCATAPQPPRYMWAKDGATAEQFRDEAWICRGHALSVPGGILDKALFLEDCLQQRGWRKVPRANTETGTP